MKKMQLSRRDFLKGAAASAVGLAAVGVLGACQKEEVSQSSAGTTGEIGGTTSGAVDENKTPESSARWSWEEAPEVIDPASITKQVDADIVIVGAGIAGCTAFMTACESGAKTVMVEKMETFSARGMDIAAVGTKVQESLGIKINKAKLVNDLMQAADFKANGSLLRLWADKSGEVLNDLIDMCTEDNLTCRLNTGSSTVSMEGDGFWNRTYPVTHALGVEELGNMGCMQHIAEREINRGLDTGNGQVFYSQAATQLVQDDTGRVTGVICANGDGTYSQYNGAKGVVLATGDFSGNAEMVDAWCPIVKETEFCVYTPYGGNAGDGFKMALQIGAGMQKGPHAPMVHPIMGGGALGTYAFLRVNKDGCRFGNEDVPLPGITNGYMTSPGHVVWTVFDSDYETQIPMMSAQSQYSGSTSGPYDPSLGLSYQEQIDGCLERGTTVKADTLEELAAAMGVPVEEFMETVNSYNQICEAGEDDQYAKSAENLFALKKAPFYASKVTAAVLVIASGLDVDSNLNVCTTEGTAIEGLYALGNTAGNLFSGDYPILAPGISHGRCITFGYLLGQALAKGETLQ